MIERNLAFCGDIHGELEKLVFDICIRLDLHNIDIVICGDIGIGFEKLEYYNNLYNSIKSRLEKNDVNIYTIRGNHDDPKYFDGLHDYPRLKFTKDHVTFKAGGKIIYPVGGGVSVDREWREKDNQDNIKKGSSRRVWWEGEKIEQKKNNLPTKVDVIVSHDAPISFEPVAYRGSDMDLRTWEEILESRKYLDYVRQEVCAKYWFHGHYHKSTSGSISGIQYRGLDIMEIYLLIENYENF